MIISSLSPPVSNSASSENYSHLPQHGLPKSSRTNCTMYGSRRFTYHHGDFSCFVSEQVSAWKKDDVEPSMAFWGIPGPSVEICMGAFPAATLRTVNGGEQIVVVH